MAQQVLTKALAAEPADAGSSSSFVGHSGAPHSTDGTTLGLYSEYGKHAADMEWMDRLLGSDDVHSVLAEGGGAARVVAALVDDYAPLHVRSTAAYVLGQLSQVLPQVHRFANGHASVVSSLLQLIADASRSAGDSHVSEVCCTYFRNAVTPRTSNDLPRFPCFVLCLFLCCLPQLDRSQLHLNCYVALTCLLEPPPTAKKQHRRAARRGQSPSHSRTAGIARRLTSRSSRAHSIASHVGVPQRAVLPRSPLFSTRPLAGPAPATAMPMIAAQADLPVRSGTLAPIDAGATAGTGAPSGASPARSAPSTPHRGQREPRARLPGPRPASAQRHGTLCRSGFDVCSPVRAHGRCECSCGCRSARCVATLAAPIIHIGDRHSGLRASGVLATATAAHCLCCVDGVESLASCKATVKSGSRKGQPAIGDGGCSCDSRCSWSKPDEGTVALCVSPMACACVDAVPCTGAR